MFGSRHEHVRVMVVSDSYEAVIAHSYLAMSYSSHWLFGTRCALTYGGWVFLKESGHHVCLAGASWS